MALCNFQVFFQSLQYPPVFWIGLGGQGIAYVTGKTPEGTYVPAAVASVSGLVEHAGMILRNDACYAYLGLRDIMSAYQDRNQGEMVSSLTVTMRKM